MDRPYVCILAAAAFAIAYKWAKGLRRPPLPPGPKHYPIIGAALSIPHNQQEWVTFSQWKDDYGGLSSLFPCPCPPTLTRVAGPINYFSVLGRDFVVLNSTKSVNDLLLQRGSIYSNRPKAQMVGPLYVVSPFMSVLLN
jgi:hypothetical protein